MVYRKYIIHWRWPFHSFNFKFFSKFLWKNCLHIWHSNRLSRTSITCSTIYLWELTRSGCLNIRPLDNVNRNNGTYFNGFLFCFRFVFGMASSVFPYHSVTINFNTEKRNVIRPRSVSIPILVLLLLWYAEECSIAKMHWTRKISAWKLFSNNSIEMKWKGRLFEPKMKTIKMRRKQREEY